MIFRDLSSFITRNSKGCMLGEPVFILGNGPSIRDNDLSKISEFFSIGTNRIYKIFDPSILIWQDKPILEEDKQGILQTKSIKMCRKGLSDSERFIYFDLHDGPFRRINNPRCLYGRGCTGGLAFELALFFGCDPIVLLGCDGVYKDGDSDFYGYNQHHNDKTLSYFNKTLLWLKETYTGKIFNCSYNDFWGKEKFTDVVKKVAVSNKNRLEIVCKLAGSR